MRGQVRVVVFVYVGLGDRVSDEVACVNALC